MEEPKKSNGMLIGVVVAIVLAVIAYAGWKWVRVMSGADSSIKIPPSPMDFPVDVPTSYLYKDGSYTSNGDYTSPGGSEQIKVSLILKDDVIVDATVVSLATRPISKKMQSNFISGFKTLVIGKKIDEVQLDKVSGSSLTPKGFNDAVSKIMVQAKV